VSARALKTLVAALGISVVLWILVRLTSGVEAPAAVPSGLSEVFGPDPVVDWDRVRLSGADRTPVELRREAGRWRVEGVGADSALVERFVTALSAARALEVVATNPANHERMGVGPGSADTLVLTRDGREWTVLLGTRGTRTGTMFVRLPDDDDVYLLDRDLSAHVRRDVEGWRDRRVVALDTARVGGVEVEREGAGRGFSLVRADSSWTLGEGGALADSTAVRNLLSELSDLTASGFLAAGDSLAALPRAASAVVLGEGGDTLTVLEVGSGDDARWVRVLGDSTLYRIPGFRADRLVPDETTLRAPR